MTASRNPYAPPLGEGTDARSGPYPSTWLGGIEVAAGLALGFRECGQVVVRNSSMGGIEMLVIVVFVSIVLVIPGVLLLRRHPLRWLLQVIPLGGALFFLYAW